MKFPVYATAQLPKLLTLSALCCSAALSAHENQDKEEAELEKIMVKGQLMRSVNGAYTTANLNADFIRDFQITEPQEILEQVSGVSIRNFGLSGVADAITVRGFGGGGHVGDLGVILDGIPLNEAMSHADGYVDLDVIVPLEIQAMDVYKGPVSALYGNFNRAGLINVTTRRSGDYKLLDLRAGSNQTFDVQGAFGAEMDEQRVNLAVQHFRSDGFRPQSETDRSTLAGAWHIALNDRTEVSISGRLHRAEGDNASYVPEELFLVDPYGVDPNVTSDGAQKTFQTLRVDVNHSINDDLTLLGFVYGTDQDFTRWFSRPRGEGWAQREEDYQRDVYGAGANLNGQHEINGTRLTWVAGIEAFQESTDFRFHDDLNNRQYTAPAINNRTVELDTTSVFIQVDAEINRYFIPSIGLRQDWFDGDCVINGPETGTDPCDELNSLDHLSPKLGVRSEITDSVQLRASWVEGFALPNGWVKFQSQANNLEPVTFEQTEVGINWQPSEQLELDLAYFELESSGELRTLAPGEFENFGATERSGIEISMMWSPVDTFSLRGVYGTADAEVVRHDNPERIGNDVGGVAEYSSTVTANWAFHSEWNGMFVWRSVGEFPLNATNTVYSDAYDVYDLTVNYSPAGNLDWRAYVTIENLTDEVYAPSQFVIGGAPVFGTAPPRQVFVGTQFNF